MLRSVWATVRGGRIEPLEPVELVEGSRLIVIILPDEEDHAWPQGSEVALEDIWDDQEDDIPGGMSASQ